MSFGKQAYIYKFTNDAGTDSYQWKTNRFEQSDAQGLITPFVQPAQTDFAIDMLGTRPGYRMNAVHTIRVMPVLESAHISEVERQQMVAKLWKLGGGKLWTLQSDGSVLWAKGRIAAMSSIDTNVEMENYFSAVAEFQRSSDWFASSQAAPTASHINSSPTTITVNNPGNYPTRNVVCRIRSNGTTGWGSSLLIENLTNSQSILVTGHAASLANNEIKISFGANSIVMSADDGVTYPVNLWPDTTIGAQKGLGNLAAGDNSIRYTTASPDFNVEFVFDVPY